MKVAVVGTGYVGLVSGTCFAELGHSVSCIDIDTVKIEKLKQGISPIYEPGLNDLITRNVKNEKLSFHADFESVADAKTIFLAVGTPSTDSGAANLEYLKQAAKQVAEKLQDDAIVVIKSTVPVGTSDVIRELIASHTKKKFHMISNPEFLKEGVAVNDFMRPDRVVIGAHNEYSFEVMEELYAPLVLQGNPIIKMNVASAEMTKYASNCFLATKISFINEIARLCEVTGANIEQVRKGMTSDARIGKRFLYPGLGYGGSCFPKDVQALIYKGSEKGRPLKIVEAVHKVNHEQRFFFLDKIKDFFKGDLSGKTIALWGVSFKPDTDDIREAPSLTIATELLKLGAVVKFYDPVAMDNFEKHFSGKDVVRCEDKYVACEGADALVLITEWTEFRAPNFDTVKERLKSPVFFDGRNLYRTSHMTELGFDYHSIGKAAR